jgi:hypothetical protein
MPTATLILAHRRLPPIRLYLRTAVFPEEIFHALGILRRDIEATIDALIQFLNATDGDCDLEDDDPAKLSDTGVADLDALLALVSHEDERSELCADGIREGNRG